MTQFVSRILENEDRSRTVLAGVAIAVSLLAAIAGTVATFVLR